MNEYLAKKIIDNKINPIKKKNLVSLFFKLKKFLIKKIKINNVVIQNNNWGFGELTKKNVTGQAKIANKNNLFCLFLKKIGTKASNEENWIIPPNCSAPTDKPNAKGISPSDVKIVCIGSTSF